VFAKRFIFFVDLSEQHHRLRRNSTEACYVAKSRAHTFGALI
jgi:hypothetical protein